jgi:hypothetical protein
MKEHRSWEGPSTRPRIEVDSTQQTLTQLTGAHRTIHIEENTLELLVGELQEQINELGLLNIVI